MKNWMLNHTLRSNQMILLGSGLCILYWIVESTVHVIVFREGNLIGQIFPSDPNEIWMRSIVLCSLILFGIYAQWAITKLKRAENVIRKARDELEQSVYERTAELKKANDSLKQEIKVRTRAEEAVRESEARNRALFENMIDGVAVYKVEKDGEDFVFVDLNETGEKISGTTRDAVVGQSVLRMFPGVVDFGLFDVFQRVARTGKSERHPVARYKDGRISQWTENSVFKLPSGEIVAVYSDETERMQAEEALKRAHDSLEQRVRERTDELENANDQLKREIEERKLAEESLQASEKRYRILTDNVADGVAIVQDRKFRFVNDALASMLGYAQSQLIGIKPFVLFHDDHKERFKELIEKIEKGVPVEYFQAPCICMDGKEIWTEARHNIVEWEGSPAVLLTVRDITETKLREFAMVEETEHIKKENINLKSSIKDRYRFQDIIGKSPAMQKIYELISVASASDTNVVIYGESGTGKELIARTIHDMSDRCKKVFVPVNCGAIPEALFESEFFGHCKGAFTGAHIDKHGFFDLAHGGTLFLDEVGELNLNMQVKLLRAIDGAGYTPVGDNKVRNADIHIIAATNRNLADMLNGKLLREDFFYRIHVIPIHVPPLRDRKEDIPLLIDQFLQRYENGNKRQAIPGEIIEALNNYDWPGNVRELNNMLQRYLAIKTLDFIKTPTYQDVDLGNISNEEQPKEGRGLRENLVAFEKEYISKMLKQNRWHRTKTATQLGIPERTFYRKLKRFQLI